MIITALMLYISSDSSIDSWISSHLIQYIYINIYYLSDNVTSKGHEQISRGQQPATDSNRGYIAMQTITADVTPPDSNLSSWA